MGTVVEAKTREFIEQGNDKKEARRMAHEYCQRNQICRSCSNPVRPDSWASFPKGYCLNCG
jgi:formamidopyrimidine-DNA glycosylase